MLFFLLAFYSYLCAISFSDSPFCRLNPGLPHRSFLENRKSRYRTDDTGIFCFILCLFF